MAVTPDSLELPVAVEKNLECMAEIFETTAGSILTSISKKDSGKRRGVKFLRIEVDE